MIRRVITAFISNALGLLAAGYFVNGFIVGNNSLTLSQNLIPFAALVAIFTFVTLIIRPLIKLVLSPLIILTLGLFNLVINGALLYIVDKYSDNITINGLPALLYGTLIITVINIIFHVSEHASRKN